MSITPQQAFEAVRVLWPDVSKILRATGNGWVACTSTDEYRVVSNKGVTLDWGDQTQYPPPAPKWRPATVEDACRAIMEGGINCRVRDRGHEWKHRTLVGYASLDGGTWITSTSANWRECEVPE